MNKAIKLQRPWAVYKGITGTPMGIGLIVEDRGDSLSIQYSEHQTYLPQSWTTQYVKRFNTSEEAVSYVLEWHPDCSKQRLLGIIQRDFPKTLAEFAQNTVNL